MLEFKRFMYVIVMVFLLTACQPPSGGSSNGDEGNPDESTPPAYDCGNGIIDNGEECDDGNIRDGDGCSSACQNQDIEPSPIAWSFNLHPEDVYEYNYDNTKPTMDEAFQEIVNLGGTMVRFDIPWRDVEPYEDASEKWSFFRDFITTARCNYNLKPIAVLGRHPDWALAYYDGDAIGDADYWLLWWLYCFNVAHELGDLIYYYQLANEANLDLMAVRDPIREEDDWQQFTECRSGIQNADSSFETIVNVLTNVLGWEDALDSWLRDAGDSIDIIGIDHYPSTWTFSSAADWEPLDKLFYYMSMYGKRGAIVETGFSTYFGWVGHSEEDQVTWVNYALPAIKQRVAGRSDIIFANFYELYDSGQLTPLPQEGFFGILDKDGNRKPAWDDLKDQIRGNPLGASAFSVSCPSPGDQVDTDNDGIADACDRCPHDPQNDADGDGLCGDIDPLPYDPVNDQDGDGISNGDNCPTEANLDQTDTDNDGMGDACDLDDDGDGTPDDQDAFPLDPEEHRDTDGDGVGDFSDADDDGDCIDDTIEYSLGSDALDPSSVPDDNDGDCIPDVMDPDDDNDDVPDYQDAFPFDPSESADTDGDLIGDNADAFDSDGDCYSNDVETSEGTDPLNRFSVPLDCDQDCNPNSTDTDDDNDGVPDSQDPFPCDLSEWSDADGDLIGDNIDLDDDNDCYPDTVELGEGTDQRNPSSTPADCDQDCNPDSADTDDDNDGVADSSDACPCDPADWADNDGDGVCDNADPDDDNDGMPDDWEESYGLNPFVNDAGQDQDHDRYSNWKEYQNGTDPNDACSPVQLEMCFYYANDSLYYARNEGNILDPTGQCSDGNEGALGVYCMPLHEWTPDLVIDTDGRGGGCQQRFSLRSSCTVDLTLCVDFQVSSGGDGGQCWNQGYHCVGLNQWTDPIVIDADSRNGWCDQQFFISGDNGYSFDLNFWADGDADQCKSTGTSTASSTYSSGTTMIGHDTDDRGGGCRQEFRLRDGEQYAYGPDPVDGYAFCGSSSYASCSGDGDCEVGGCSGQLCKGVGESKVTVCDVRDCYDSSRYGISCGCYNNQCAWKMP